MPQEAVETINDNQQARAAALADNSLEVAGGAPMGKRAAEDNAKQASRPKAIYAASASTLMTAPKKGGAGYFVCKRIFDIVFSASVCVIVAIPVAIACAAIAIESPGNPLFRQERVGQSGKPIRIFKLRSMVADAHTNPQKYMTTEQYAVWKREQKLEDDPRVTKVGRILRRTSLDELPQLLNVLMGDIPLRILKMRLEFSVRCMGAFALPAKFSTNKEIAFSQVVGCFASGLRRCRVFGCNSIRIGDMEAQFLAKPVFGVVCA